MARVLFDTDSIHATNLLELVEVVPGGIVSKPLLETECVKQVLFALDAGQQLSEHTSPSVATVHVLEGTVYLRVDGAEHQLGPHGWLMMPENAPHELRAQEPAHLLLTLVKR